LVKLRAEGIKEQVARAPANWWRVAVAWKQSRTGAMAGKQNGVERGGKKYLLLDVLM
jgi:hypothetical protein